MSESSGSYRPGWADRVGAVFDLLWIEEKVVWSALLLTILLFAIVDLPFSIRLVAGGYALFLGRIAAIVVLIVGAHRLWMRWVRGVTYEPFGLADVWHFLRTLGFYIVSLTTYTNLKTHTLLLNPRVFDNALEVLDRWMFLGQSPTEMALALTDRPTLTALLDISYAYAWAPLAIVFGVVFSQQGGEGFRRLARIVSLNYLVGALLYIALPAVGPAFARRELYEGLVQSVSFQNQNRLIYIHNLVIDQPREFLVPAFMGIAAFPSLHMSHVYLPLLVAWRRARPLFYVFLLPFVAVALSTVYFGWHWVIDIPAGIATIHLCMWLANRMERFEEKARSRRQASSASGWLDSAWLARGLSQWPLVASVAALHLIGLIVALVLIGPPDSLSWGSRAALLFFLGFVVLFEACVVIAAFGLLEGLARTPGRTRWLDSAKSLGIAAFLTLLAASLLKLAITGSPIGRLDLWFVGRNLGQLAGESLGIEVGLGLVLLVLCLVIAILVYRGLQALRRRPLDLPARPFLLLALLAALGVSYSATRYPEAATVGRSLAPEIGWLLGDAPAASTAGRSSRQAMPLAGAPIEPYSPAPPEDPPNIVLVMLESVPWSVMESEDAAAATPNLRALADQSITFSRAYAPSVHSDYAQMAILSSLHPRKFEDHDYYERIEYPRTLLWDTLAAAGWSTAMFSCQNEGWGNMINYLRTPGLQTLEHSPDWPTAPHRGRGSESKVFEATAVDAWQSWLEADGSSPWLTYLNFQATHFPYEVPAQAPHPFEPWEIDFPASFIRYPVDKVPVMRNRYLNALAYSDRYLGEIVRMLEERGEWERTILIVVSDHGEAFYEHSQPTHGTQLFEEQVRSLMMVRLPGGAPRLVDEPVSLLDLVPSLMDYLGLPPHGNFQGRSDIFAADYSARGRPFLFTIQGLTSEDGVLLDDWKYTVNWRTGDRQLYHVASDPYEKDDLADTDSRRAEQLHQLLSDLLDRQLAYYDQRGWESGVYAERLP